MRNLVATFILLGSLQAVGSAQKLATVDGVTFADTGRGKIYLPIRETAKHLGWKVGGKPLKMNSHAIPASRQRVLPTGVRLVEVGWLRHSGAIVGRNGKTGLITVKLRKKPGRAFYVRAGQKRVFINKKAQTLIAYQGQRTVMRSHVSTGRAGQETPLGIFRAQGKEKMHRSRLYHNAPMPWAVHIVGNIFVHGFKSTPSNGSSGCIRLPLTGSNPARWFYYWTEVGTPVTISGKWPSGAYPTRSRSK